MPYPLTAAIVGLILAVIIVVLLRRDRLYIRDAIFWLATACVSVLFAIFPRAIDWIASAAGVAYPPALLFGIVTGILLVKALLSDIAVTELRRDVRRLNQRIALSSDYVGEAKSTTSRQDPSN
jgi:hypothetical protein